MRSKDLIEKYKRERPGDSIMPPDPALKELERIIDYNETAPLGSKVSAKEALEAMRTAGATSVRSIARVNDVCRKYLQRRSFYVE